MGLGPPQIHSIVLICPCLNVSGSSSAAPYLVGFKVTPALPKLHPSPVKPKLPKTSPSPPKAKQDSCSPGFCDAARWREEVRAGAALLVPALAVQVWGLMGLGPRTLIPFIVRGSAHPKSWGLCGRLWAQRLLL